MVTHSSESHKSRGVVPQGLSDPESLQQRVSLDDLILQRPLQTHIMRRKKNKKHLKDLLQHAASYLINMWRSDAAFCQQVVLSCLSRQSTGWLSRCWLSSRHRILRWWWGQHETSERKQYWLSFGKERMKLHLRDQDDLVLSIRSGGRHSTVNWHFSCMCVCVLATFDYLWILILDLDHFSYMGRTQKLLDRSMTSLFYAGQTAGKEKKQILLLVVTVVIQAA